MLGRHRKQFQFSVCFSRMFHTAYIGSLFPIWLVNSISHYFKILLKFIATPSSILRIKIVFYRKSTKTCYVHKIFANFQKQSGNNIEERLDPTENKTKYVQGPCQFILYSYPNVREGSSLGSRPECHEENGFSIPQRLSATANWLTGNTPREITRDYFSAFPMIRL